jgi:hypothetical protein
MPAARANVCFSGYSGLVVLTLSSSARDPGRVKKALYLRHPQNAASIRVTELKFSWKPFFERP